MNEITPIKSLEIKIDKNSKVPHVVLNGVDFINEKNRFARIANCLGNE